MLHRRFWIVFLLTIFCLAWLTPAWAGKKSQTKTNHPALTRARAVAYSIPAGLGVFQPGAQSDRRAPLGTVSYSSASESPGLVVGQTYRDEQQICSMGRMVETGPYAEFSFPTIVHFGWTFTPDAFPTLQSYAYNAYVASTGMFAGATIIQVQGQENSAYVNVDVTEDNRALVGGHCNLRITPSYVHFAPQIHFDAAPASEDFSAYVRVPESHSAFDQDPAVGNEAMWPKFFMQFGTDSILHVVARIKSTATMGTLMYFRCHNPEYFDADWSYAPYLFDTTQLMSYDICGDRLGDDLGIAWLATLPYQEPVFPTHSGMSPYNGTVLGQMDNDLYFQSSINQGTSWLAKQNITMYGGVAGEDFGKARYKAAFDISMLYDRSHYFHVIWNAVPWPADTCWQEGGGCFTEDFYTDKTRMFHWSQNVPSIRTISDHTYRPSDSCGSPAWGGTIAKMTLSECGLDTLYVIWSQFNDVQAGISEDCAQWVYDKRSYRGGANADVWIAVSDDGGLTWDAHRNLTNSFTPHCDPEYGYECENDYWASMSRRGRPTLPAEIWTPAQVIVPVGGNPTDWFLDIFYVNDKDAGSAVQGEGSWQYSDLKWFRVPCVEPVPAPKFAPEFVAITSPAWVQPGIEKDTVLTIENIGNVDLHYTIWIEEDNGPAGWLTHSGFSGSISAGLGNTETGTIYLNTGGIVDQAYLDNLAVDALVLYGRLIFDGDGGYNCDPYFPDTIGIEFIVADTLICPAYDTVRTNCLTLAVSNFGDAGRYGYGGQNMDYSEYEGVPVDCDTSVIAEVYLYQNSLLLARNGGADWSSTLWGTGWLDDDGFRPQGGQRVSRCCPGLNAQVYESGTFTTADTTIAFERIWVAPRDECNFIIQYSRMWSYDGGTHTGLLLGEVTDWDVPYDDDWNIPNYDDEALPFNWGGIDVSRNLSWSMGYDCYCDGDSIYPYNCGGTLYNDERFGGSAFMGTWFNGSVEATAPYSQWFEWNGPVQASPDGFIGSAMYDWMTTGGMWANDTVHDMHAGICFDPNIAIDADDVFEAVTVLATIQQGTLADLQAVIDQASAWFAGKGGINMFADDGDGQIDVCESCCVLRGDLNCDGRVSSGDVIFGVDFLWKSGPAPCCMDHLDVNGSCTNSSADIIYLVDFMWKGGPAPVPCE